jgi:hypothetical protein
VYKGKIGVGKHEMNPKEGDRMHCGCVSSCLGQNVYCSTCCGTRRVCGCSSIARRGLMQLMLMHFMSVLPEASIGRGGGGGGESSSATF